MIRFGRVIRARTRGSFMRKRLLGGARPRSASGFTMIELMIVVAIVGILAAIAIPQYQSYTTRARITEGLVLLSPVKLAVVEYHATHGRLPAATNWLVLLRELGLPVSASSGAAAGTYVKRIWWNNTAQEIRIRYGFAPIDDKLLYLQASFNAEGRAAWRCYAPAGASGVPARYLPSTCRA